MPVFISHKREDTKYALWVKATLEQQSVKCYVDVMDPELRTTDDLTATLMARIHMCTHLMAVVSDYTTQSWWVPFEIGVATEIDRRISTFQVSVTQLPDFLTKWPVLKSSSDLDLFVQTYRNDATVSFNEVRNAQAVLATAGAFHRELKRRLGQRP